MTPVIFRKWKDNEEVVALFPTIPADMCVTDTCSSYVHFGQHGPAQYNYVISQTQPATLSDYVSLFAELVKVGYDDLKVYSRVQPWMHEERRTNAL